MRVVQVGYGYWGANIANKLLRSSKFELVAVCDITPQLQVKARVAMSESVVVSEDYHRFLEDDSIAGFIIATQTERSFEIAMNAMSARKHVFIEKPIATTVERTQKLNAKAAEMDVILHCDHLLLYNPYYRYIKKLIDSGELGDLIYVDVQKLNLGPIRMDVNALMDLAVHDVAAVDWFSNGKTPKSVTAVGYASVGEQETLTFLNLKYDSFIVNINSSWISPVKVRKTIVAGTKKMVIFDDMKSDEKLRVYDSGIDVVPKEDYNEYAFLTRKGDIHIPQIEFEDSLQNSLEYFENCVVNNQQSISGPEASLRVMQILEVAQNDLAQQEKEG